MAQAPPCKWSQQVGLLMAAAILLAGDARVLGETSSLLTGRLVSASGDEVSKAVLELVPSRRRHDRVLERLGAVTAPEAKASTRSDLEGRFRLSAPEHGRWQLRVRWAGRRYAARLAVVGPQHLGTLRLPATRELSVRVVAAGQPVEGARVERVAWRPRDLQIELDDPSSRTGENGRGTVTVTESSTLLVVHPEFAARSVVVDGSTPQSLEVGLERGELTRFLVAEPDGVRSGSSVALHQNVPVAVANERGEVDLVLAPNEPLDVHWLAASGGESESRLHAGGGPHEIVLRHPERAEGLVMAQGEPVAGALVWSAPGVWTIADQEGRFALVAPRGRYGRAGLQARAAGFAQAGAGVSSGALVSIELRPAVTVEGRVTDPLGAPVRGALVRGGRQAAESDARGRFVLRDASAARALTLTAGAEGYAPTKVSVARPGEPVEIVLHEGRTLIGWVTDGADQPLVDARAGVVEQPETLHMWNWQARRSVVALDDALSVATSVDGEFRLPHVAPGRYDLVVTRTGFLEAHVPGIEVTGHEGDLELGTVSMRPSSSLQGLVRGPQGDPVAGAKVNAQSRGARSHDTTTAADGSFRLDGLDQDEALAVRVSAPGYLARRLQGVRPRDGALEVTLEPALEISGVVLDLDEQPVEDARVELQDTNAQRGRAANSGPDGRFVIQGVRPGTHELLAGANGYAPFSREIRTDAGIDSEELMIRLEAGSQARGLVLDEDGTPVAGANVYVQPEYGRRQVRANRAETDTEGRFTLGGLTDGRQRVTVTKDGYLRKALSFVAGTQAVELEIALEPRPQLRGQVISAGGTPVPGAQVTAAMTGAGMRSSTTLTSDGEGYFEPRFKVNFRSLAFVAQHPEHGVSPEVTIHLQDDVPELVELRLEQAATIRGRIVGLGLEELASTSVSVSGSPGRQVAPVDFEGRFEISAVPPGVVQLVARVAGAGRERRRALDVVAGDNHVELVFGDGATLRGLVLRDDLPVRGVRISVEGTDVASSGIASTDAAGSFTVPDLPLGTYRLRATGEGLAEVRHVDLDGDLDLVLEPSGGGVTGLVVDQEGTPLAGASVWACPTSGQPCHRWQHRAPGRTASDGRFELTGLPRGGYTVSAERAAYLSAHESVEVDGDVTSVTLMLERGDRQALRVLSSRGFVPGNIEVSLHDDRGAARQRRQVSPDAQGVFHLDVPEGTWRVLATEGSEIGALTLVAPGDPPTLTLQPAGFLDIVVPPGEGARRTTAELRLEGEPPGFGRPHGDSGWHVLDPGVLRVGPLLPGTWVLELADGRAEEALVEPGQRVRLEID